MVTPLISAAVQAVQVCDRVEKSQQAKFEGFDFLRAIFSVMVVVLHANLLVALTGKLGLGSLANVLSANVGYLAVPVFFQVSLFLFFLKSEKFGQQYFIKNRLPKLVSLYLFWSISKLIFDFVLTGKSPKIEYGASSWANFIGFIVGGGYSPFYFFFSLIFLTAIAEVLTPIFSRVRRRTAKRISYYLLLSSCLLVFAFPIADLMIAGNRELLTQIHNPLAFLPYVLTAAITVQNFKEGKLQAPTPLFKLKLFSLLVLFLTFTVLEWALFEKFSQYSRLSLVFGSWLLLYLSLLSNQKSPPIIKFLSGCSLGIYGLHVFFTDHTFFLESLSKIVPGLGPLTRFLVALLGSIFLTLVFRRTKVLRNFV
jgi:surface polysaccharide O-acyltransferase-like enzyme